MRIVPAIHSAFFAGAALLASSSQTRAAPASPASSRFPVVQDCLHCPPLVRIDGVPPPTDPLRRGPGRVLFVGQREITWEEYLEAVDRGGCNPPQLLAGKLSDPADPRLRDSVAVTGISLADAQCYVQWLSKITGRAYRLPTSAEWQFAAHGGRSTKYPWGEELGENRAFVIGAYDPFKYRIRDFLGPRSPSNIREVAMLEPNDYGLYDVIGNAAELTSTLDKTMTERCIRRQMRVCVRVEVHGISFDDASIPAISYVYADERIPDVGFRVVRDWAL